MCGAISYRDGPLEAMRFKSGTRSTHQLESISTYLHSYGITHGRRQQTSHPPASLILTPHSVPHFPSEDSKLRATALQVRRGGNCPNSLQVLAQLVSRHGPEYHPPGRPLKLHLVSSLPDRQSAATREILSSFGNSYGGNRSAGEQGDDGAGPAGTTIDFSHSLYRPGHEQAASSYILRSSETGSRTIVNFNNLPEMSAAEFEKIADAFLVEYRNDAGDDDGSCCWWHFEYLRRLMPQSRISVEVEKPGREGLVELAAEVLMRTPACSGNLPVVLCSSLMLCTWGEQGAGALAVPSGDYIHQAANPSGDTLAVVDTIGAGDTFIAGVLFGLHADAWSREATLAFGVGLATKKVQREGFAGLVP
ncbi:hypothetical protein N0V88_001180 [Collariella sp. IMI 366227]|nr:hypothetical protein N0V88_001180 [Collariella sp. IMI 366227]